MDLSNENVYLYFNSIASIYLRLRRATELNLKKLDITYPQFGVLLITWKNPNIIQKEAAQLLETDTTTIMVICDSLENKKLIQRLPSENDRRAKMLLLTAAGEDLIKRAFPLVIDLYKAALNIDEKQVNDSLQTFELILKNIKQLESGT